VHRGSVEQAHQTEMARVVGHDGKRVNCNNNTQQGHDADSSVQKVNETETLPPQDTEKHRQAEAMATRLVGAVHEVRVKKREKKAEQQRAKKKQPHKKKTKKRKKVTRRKQQQNPLHAKLWRRLIKRRTKETGRVQLGRVAGKRMLQIPWKQSECLALRQARIRTVHTRQAMAMYIFAMRKMPFILTRKDIFSLVRAVKFAVQCSRRYPRETSSRLGIAFERERTNTLVMCSCATTVVAKLVQISVVAFALQRKYSRNKREHALYRRKVQEMGYTFNGLMKNTRKYNIKIMVDNNNFMLLLL
jgi:hypothetical protein